MRQRRNMFQMKEQNKTPEEISKMETGNVPKKEFKVMIIKMTKELQNRMDAKSKKLEVLTKNQKIERTTKQN